MSDANQTPRIIGHSKDSASASTWIDAGIDQLGRLARAIGLEDRIDAIETLFRRALTPWGATRASAWPSAVSDDHTPFTWSLELEGDHVALRWQVEPLGDSPSLLANRERALGLLAALEREGLVTLGALHVVSDLLLPPEPVGTFSAWLGFRVPVDGPIGVTIDLNPQAQGPGLAQALTEAALVRLGFDLAWATVARTLVRRGPVLDELTSFSIDLSPGEGTRVVVRARHHHPTIAELEAAVEGTGAVRLKDVLGPLAIDPDDRLWGRPPETSLAFRSTHTDPSAPVATTLHVPIHGYAHDDRDVAERIERLLVARGLDATAHRRAIEALSTRPLADGLGLQSHVSTRFEPGPANVTVQLAPELVHPGTVARLSPRTAPTTPEEIVGRFEAESLADHPFFRRLRREPPNLAALWKLIANAELGIVRDFSRRLAQVTARVTDDRIRSILAHQLNDELGHGQFDRAHSQLFQALLRGLTPFRPANVDEHAVLAPGRVLTVALEEIYATHDPYEGVGAAIVIEIFGKQVDTTVGDEFRRQHQVDPKSLEWLNLHEELEQDHANESLLLAHLVPAAQLPSVWRGAERTWIAADAFFHGMYGVAFG